jgi:hypothetical protein
VAHKIATHTASIECDEIINRAVGQKSSPKLRARGGSCGNPERQAKPPTTEDQQLTQPGVGRAILSGLPAAGFQPTVSGAQPETRAA